MEMGTDDWYGCMFLPLTALLEMAVTAERRASPAGNGAAPHRERSTQ